MRTIADVVKKAEILEEKGDYRKAERLYKKALVMQEKKVGFDHPELAAYLYNLGMIQSALEKNTEAERNLNRLLNILLTSRSETDFDVQEILLVIDEIRQDVEEVPTSAAATA
ncbi:MAG TPA: tetratricopeptide repeat protein [Candidatus Obscuribacterales bacterium]